MRFWAAALFFLLVFAASPGFAVEEDSSNAVKGFNASNLPVPRFASLASGEVNLRTGPGLRYPIRLILTKDALPVEIIREFDTWREIRDADGDTGWVHKSLLSGRRTGLVFGAMRTVYKKNSADARPVVKLEPGVIVDIDHCEQTWCYIKIAGYKGWIRRDGIWGIYANEEID